MGLRTYKGETDMQEEFLFAGFGGQGVMFVGQLLAYAAMDYGKEVTWIPSYGPEMRGGTAHCYVVISDKAIGSPVVSRPGTGIIFNIPSFEKYEPIIKPGGLLVVNSSMVPEAATQRQDLRLLKVPATDMASEKMGNTRLANVIILGALLAAHSIMPVDFMKEALSHHIPAHRRNLLDSNYQALEMGAEFAVQQMAKS